MATSIIALGEILIFFFHQCVSHPLLLLPIICHWYTLSPSCNNPTCLQKSSDVPCKTKSLSVEDCCMNFHGRTKTLLGSRVWWQRSVILALGTMRLEVRSPRPVWPWNHKFSFNHWGYCVENCFCCFIEKNVFSVIQSCYWWSVPVSLKTLSLLKQNVLNKIGYVKKKKTSGESYST